MNRFIIKLRKAACSFTLSRSNSSLHKLKRQGLRAVGRSKGNWNFFFSFGILFWALLKRLGLIQDTGNNFLRFLPRQNVNCRLDSWLECGIWGRRGYVRGCNFLIEVEAPADRQLSPAQFWEIRAIITYHDFRKQNAARSRERQMVQFRAKMILKEF